MVLLENFGAKPSIVQFNRPNRNNFVPLLLRSVVRILMIRIPKLRRENYPERGKNEGKEFSQSF